MGSGGFGTAAGYGRSRKLLFADGSTAVKDPGSTWKVERFRAGVMYRGEWPCKAEVHVKRLEGSVRYSQAISDHTAHSTHLGAGPIGTSVLEKFFEKVAPWMK